VPSIRYVGGFAEADVVLVGVSVKRGETFDATDEQAAVLLLSANYELAPAAKASAKANPAQEG
jgi:hypothetical protein